MCRTKVVAIAMATFTIGGFFASPAEAAIEPRDVLKSYFETGDKPTEQQFASLIDSNLNFNLDFGGGLDGHLVDLASLIGGSAGIAGDGSGGALLVSEGNLIDSLLQFSEDQVSVGGGTSWPDGAGFLGLRFDLDGPGGITSHYGFLQMRVDGPAAATPYAIHVDAFAYETTPDTPITTFNVVPEPSAGLLLLIAAACVCERRRAAWRF